MSDRCNDCSSPEQQINHIKCDVVNCHYHGENSCCYAKMIEVGPSFAVSENDTACSTFKAK